MNRDRKEERTRGTRDKSYLHLFLLPLLSITLLSLTAQSSPLKTRSRLCQTQDVKALTGQMLRDLPSYANRASQRARRLSITNDSSYLLVAGRPEFDPLTLGPGAYTPETPNDSESVQQVFFTTLERQYIDGEAVELQEFHWLFLTRTGSGWRLARMLTQTGTYPAKQPPTPPRDSSYGVIAQAVEAWLRDCEAESGRLP